MPWPRLGHGRLPCASSSLGPYDRDESTGRLLFASLVCLPSSSSSSSPGPAAAPPRLLGPAVSSQGARLPPGDAFVGCVAAAVGAAGGGGEAGDASAGGEGGMGEGEEVGHTLQSPPPPPLVPGGASSYFLVTRRPHPGRASGQGWCGG